MSNSETVSNDFYTNVKAWGNSILYRGVKDGKRIKMKIEYEPSLYIESKKPTDFKNLHGKFLEQKKFDSMKDAKDYVKQFDGVSNASPIYGNTRYEYAFIADQHKGMIEYDKENVLIGIIDIEVGGGQYANIPDKKILVRKKT